MTEEEYLKHKPFAGEAKPSMLRRRIGHDYSGRCIYLVTVTIEGRRPLLGTLVGRADAPDGSPEAPHIELTELGRCVRNRWAATSSLYRRVKVLATMVMPDHLHGILFFEGGGEADLGKAVRGFKAACNKEYRRLFPEEAAARALFCRSGRGAAAASAPASAAAAASASAGTRCLQRKQEGNPPPASPPVSSAATAWQRPASPPRSELPGLLWSPGYNDHILEGDGELERWFVYLQENPRRLAVRRAHPEYFRVAFGVSVATRSYSAIGNRHLLAYPWKVQVQYSRSLTGEQVKAEVETCLMLARSGAVLVSPAISECEQAVMRAVLDARLPLVFLTPWGFNSFSKPGHQYYEACAEGRFLILAPWPHINRRVPLTRAMCLQLNAMAKEIAEY